MSYLVIAEDGTAQAVDTAPTIDALAGHVRGCVDLVRTRASRLGSVAVWCNDDFATLAANGTLARNITGTVFAVGLGAAKQPYAGPLVVTGAPNSYGKPTSMRAPLRAATITTLDDLRAVLAGGDPPADMADSVVATSHTLASLAELAPFPKPVVYTFDTIEDLLAFQRRRRP